MPAGVELEVLIDRLEDPEPEMAFGEKLAVAPEGKPDMPRVTLPVKPPDGATLTLYVVPVPESMLREAGVTVTEKSDWVVT